MLQTFNFSDICEDLIFLFTLCYDNNLNFNRLYRLYKLSDKVFWGYIGALTPILKVGVKKVSSYTETSYNVMNFIKKVPYTELNPFDKKIYELIQMFVKNIYANADYTIIKSQDELSNNRTLLCRIFGNKDFKEINVHKEDTFDDVVEVILAGNTYYKTSRIEAILGKYYEDIKVSDINGKTLKELEDMIMDLRVKK